MLNDALDTLVDGISSIFVFLGIRTGKERLSAVLRTGRIWKEKYGGFRFQKIKTLQILGIHEPMGKENVIRDALDDVFKDDLVTEDPLLRLTEKGKLLLKKSLTTSFAGILKGNGGSGKKIFPDLHDLYYYRNHGFRFHWI
ncbi:MAG: hypothetical protein ACLFSE_08675, partial [Spirochaetia bacterium]